MFYQKLKDKVRFLEENLKGDITKIKMTEQVLGSANNEKAGKKTKGFWGLIFSKLGLQELGLFFRSIYLITFRLILNLVEVSMIIFGDPAKSFNLLYKQHGLSACPIPYATFKTKQKHAKVFSLAGVTTIVLVTAMSSLLVNLMVGPIERTLAATYYWTQASWTTLDAADEAIHGTDNNGWVKYISKDAGVTAGATLSVAMTSNDWNDSTTFDTFDDPNTDDETSLAVLAGSVTLLKPGGAKCSADSECQNNDCAGGYCYEPSLVVYLSAGTYNGNLGGRTGANTKCMAERPTGVTETAYALMSFSATDEVRDFWSNYSIDTNARVYWQNRSDLSLWPMANNMADMLDGAMVSAQFAGYVFLNVWHGTTSNGGLYIDGYGSTLNCSGFSTNSSIISGAYERTSARNFQWDYGARWCYSYLNIICAYWKP
jgi:hypothetical protein